MKRSIARKWAKALESGEYKQCTGQLRKGKSFCCLGVLCNLHAEAHPELAKTQKNKKEYFGNGETLPEEVMDWANIRCEEGALDKGVQVNGRYYEELTGLNDTAKLTFPEIAKVIRKHWKEL